MTDALFPPKELREHFFHLLRDPDTSVLVPVEWNVMHEQWGIPISRQWLSPKTAESRGFIYQDALCAEDARKVKDVWPSVDREVSRPASGDKAHAALTRSIALRVDQESPYLVAKSIISDLLDEGFAICPRQSLRQPI